MGTPTGFRPPPTGADGPIVPWGARPRTVLISGLALWVLAYAASQATVSDAHLPALFLPAAIGVGLLLRLPMGLWWVFLTSMALVDIVGGALTGIATPAVALIWGVFNVSQTLLLALILTWARVDMTRARDPVVMSVSAAVVVTFSSVAGSLCLAAVSDVEAEQFWADWWGSDVLSIVLVVPVILLLGRAAPPRGRLGWEALGWLVVTAAAVGLAFADKLDPLFPAWLWLILGAPLVVLYGVRFGLLAMSLFLFVLDFIAVSLTAVGLGPFQQLAFSVDGTPLRSLQLVLIVLAVTVQSVSLLVYAALRHGRTLAGQQALLDAVIEGSPVATAVLDTHDGHRVLRTNAAFRELLPDAPDVADFSTLFPLSERDGLARLLSADSQRASGEFAVTDAHGEPGLVQSRVATVTADAFDKYGTLRPAAVAYRVVQAEDMTDVRRRELRLQHAADTDSLTGLANRRTLLKTLQSEIRRAAPGRLLTVAFVDLDGFKEVNDRRGHHAGDQVLCDVARCLSDSVCPDDLVARVGGDEFVVVSSEVPDRATALGLAQRLLEGIVHNPATSGLVAASIGLVVQDGPNVTADALLQRADALMYDAKSRGGGKVVATPE